MPRSCCRDGVRCAGSSHRSKMASRSGWLVLLAVLHIGCDGVVGSGRVLDACGDCGGNNSTCQIISGIFTEPYLKAGYRQVVQIPAGACSIRIEELGATKNYLALSDSKGEFIINGDWNIDLSGTYRGAGTRFKYQRQHQKKKDGELISAKGPTSEPVDLFILYRQANRGIKYEYAIKHNSSLTSVLPRLLTGSGGAKVPPMAGSLLRRPADQPRPRDAPAPPSRGGFVSPLYQSSAAGSSVPFPRADTTSQGPKRHRRRRRRRSRFQWVVTGYSECSKSCGGGTRTTEVVCMKRKRKQLAPDRNCKAANRPEPTTISCNTRPCPARWEPASWSACSVTCGAGQKMRPMRCVRDSREVAPAECPGEAPPANTQACQQLPCPAGLWQIGAWTSCSVTCGWGQRSRQVTCQPTEGRCSEADRPRHTQPCRRIDCDDAEGQDGWMFTEWSQQCSVECGQGVQWRQVTCGGSCDAHQKPEETRPCKTDRGCAGTWFTGPWSRCSHTCGAGAQMRPVTCVRFESGQFSVVADATCAAPRPPAEQACSGGSCPARWHGSDWAACSASCGSGQQSRAVACLAADGAERVNCAETDRLQKRRDCLLIDCPRRAFFDWGSENETKPLGSAGDAPPLDDNGNHSLPTLPSDGAARVNGPAPSDAGPTEAHDVVNSIANDHPLLSDNSLEPTLHPSGGTSAAPPPLTPAPATEAAASSAAPEVVERPPGRRQRPRKHRKHRQRPAGDQQHRDQSNSLSAGSCTDRFNNCLLVQQARLCKYKYYKTHCCATCKAP